MPITDLQVRNEEDLYAGIKNIPWEKFMAGGHIRFSCTLNSDLFTTRILGLKAKDALVDRFGNVLGNVLRLMPRTPFCVFGFSYIRTGVPFPWTAAAIPSTSAATAIKRTSRPS